ncbi:sigma-70 family RNA polymerase sigma factor [Pseudomonas sp. Gutcm_11s]|uniref:sigma-70 family RNA polymerase sigma factor n=1 Tax=Pseudomonas sp. Gutcm_11s TaxID=3026088 RepID=UPI0023618E0D|nr:sigma-70 family RNA polymerase sigma factor [Pseudomonas sp. Gutcm_11s]MDD0843583.1 sigma-70 family RNA polymerase sigma factor [Pseudomonas sp. Gutcm_11s]
MGMLGSWGDFGSTPVASPQDVKENGLESLYTGHRRVLIDAAQSVLGCRARAEDVVHDAFLKLWESGDRHAIEDPLRYLFRMVRNLSIDRLRRHALEGRYSADDELLDELPAPQSGPEQRAIGQLEWQRLQLALGELPERTRTVFTMSQLEGYSQREVASHLSASPTLVHFLLRDALSHCRSRLEPEAA